MFDCSHNYILKVPLHFLLDLFVYNPLFEHFVWFQVFLSNTNNLYTIIWYQVTISTL